MLRNFLLHTLFWLKPTSNDLYWSTDSFLLILQVSLRGDSKQLNFNYLLKTTVTVIVESYSRSDGQICDVFPSLILFTIALSKWLYHWRKSYDCYPDYHKGTSTLLNFVWSSAIYKVLIEFDKFKRSISLYQYCWVIIMNMWSTTLFSMMNNWCI